MSDNEWTPNETWQDAMARSREICGPSDVKPVKWSCNPERKWVHLTESEWIGLHDAFDAQNKKLMALQDCISELDFEMSQLLENKGAIDLSRWMKRIEAGRRGEWPFIEPESPDAADCGI